MSGDRQMGMMWGTLIGAAIGVPIGILLVDQSPGPFWILLVFAPVAVAMNIAFGQARYR